MQRLTASVSALFALVLVTAPAATAQEQDAAQLTLVSQTPWNSIDQPKLEVTVRAVNTGDAALDQLSLGITLWAPVHSRTTYELSLVSDPVPASVVDGETRLLDGTLEPGSTRTLAFTLDLLVPGVSTTQSLIYPLKVELRSRGLPVGALRTAVIFLVRMPETPLALAWTFVLHEPILFAPDGRFRSSALERSLAPGGTLAGEIRALDALVRDFAGKPVDVAVSPTLLTQLARMRAGYTVLEGSAARQVPAGQGGSAAAAEALAAMKRIVASAQVETSALPFAAPKLPALVAGGLARDLPVQLQRGRDQVKTVLGSAPVPTVLRPPGSALDQASLEALPGEGIDLLVLDPAAVPPAAQPLGFAAPPTAALVTDGVTVTAVVPDAGLQALLSSPMTTADPVLGAQAVLGELAAIWLERPGIERGVALTVPEDLLMPGAFFGPLVRGIAGAPWIHPMPATGLAETFPPSDPVRLQPIDTGSFAHAYIADLKDARRLIDAYRSMLVNPSPVPDQLETTLLWAESGEFVDVQLLGIEFVHSVRDVLSAQFRKVWPDTGLPVTLTSSTGRIPIRLTNETGQPVRITVELVSPHLRFTQGASQGPVQLAGGEETLNFNVQLQTTGRFQVQVLVKSPSGRVVNKGTLIIRSTAYNRVALIVTLGAALVLMALWARRFLPRRTT